MITTVKLINTPLTSPSYHCVCVVRTLAIYSQQISGIRYSIIYYSHHAVITFPEFMHLMLSWCPFLAAMFLLCCYKFNFIFFRFHIDTT